MGFYGLTYHRPAFTPKQELRRSQSSLEEKTSLRSGKSGVLSGIPADLSFDRIVSGKTCPPITIREFMNYLLYIEHSAENLQFYLWHQDYIKRFKAATTTDLALAPEWTKAMEDEIAIKLQKEATEHLRREVGSPHAELFKGTDFEKKPAVSESTAAASEGGNPFSTPPRTPATPTSNFFSERESTYAPSSHMTSATYRSQASEAFSQAGAKTPFTIQPFREEINRIISTYIMDRAPRQLNLSDRDRKAVMHALSYTTHPSAMRIAFEAVDHSLRLQNHPNFIRWSICNGNPTRISGARAFGYSGVLFGFLIAVILTLSSAPRGYRAFAAVFWSVAIGGVIASYRGMCVCMWTTHNHHIRPWELFEEDAEDLDGLQKRSFESFGSNNSFEHEPWVQKYERQSAMRKIFDKEAWIQEPALRAIQDTIFVQSMAIGGLVTVALLALFIPLPSGNFF